MLISSLQQFLRLLAPPLAAAGINATSQKNVTASLEALADSLEPLRDLSVDQLADLVRVAREYRETGQIPEWVTQGRPKAARARVAKAPPASKLTPAEAVAKLRDIQHRSRGLDPGQITSEVQALSALTAADLKVVHRDFLGAVMGKTKPELLVALQKKIHDFRSSGERVDSIRLF